MRNYFICVLLSFGANALAMDSYNPSTGILQLDGVVQYGTQYNNVIVQLPGYSLISEGTNSTPYPSASACQSGNVPSNWKSPQASYQLSGLPPEPTQPLNTITLVLFRHGEKTLQTAENGNMSSTGQLRAQLLPARLNTLFGCPDYTIATNPSGLIPSGLNAYNYVRPAATIEPTATTLGFPLWMPYGASNPQWLAHDLLTNSEFAPTSLVNTKTAFIAWEHNNIVLMTNYITNGDIPIPALPDIPAGIPGMSVDGTGETVTLNGAVYNCEPLPTIPWPECDYDSIWVLNIHNGNHVCYIHLYEELDNLQYQNMCRSTSN